MQNADFTIYRGIDHDPVLVVFKDSSGTQVDLTGWLVFSQARTTPNYRPRLDLAPFILGTGTLLYGTTGPGRVKLAEFTADQTNAMSEEDLVWDVILQDPDGKRHGPYRADSTLSIKNSNTQP